MVHWVTVSTDTGGGWAVIGVSRRVGPIMPIGARSGSPRTSRVQKAPHSRPTAFTCGAAEDSRTPGAEPFVADRVVWGVGTEE